MSVLDCLLRDPRSIYVHIQYVRMNPRNRLGYSILYHHSEDSVFIFQDRFQVLNSKYVAVEAQRSAQ